MSATRSPLFALALLSALFAVQCAPALGQTFQPEASFGAGEIVDPAAIATDGAGRVFVADAASRRIEVFDNFTAGNAYLGSFGEDDGLGRPSGIAVETRGRIYVADADRSVIVRYNALADGATPMRLIGSPGTARGQFLEPRHIAVDSRPQVFVADRQNIRVQWTVITGRPVGAFGVGDLNPPGFASPSGIARDRDGRLYVTSDEPGAGGVRVYDKRGFFLRAVAGPGDAPANVSGPAGVAVDRAGRVLVADTGHGRVQAFDSFAAGSAFRDAVGGLGAPSDVALAPGAMLYVADRAGHRIVRIRYDDADRDGVLDALDRCPGVPDPEQRDADRDGLGDACDPETRARKRLAHGKRRRGRRGAHR